MKILAIDHIGIAVRSLEEALEFYVGRLGLAADAIEEKPGLGIRLVRVRAANVVLELIEAADWERTTQRYLDHKGPGVYHVGLEVDDVDAAITELREKSTRLIDEVPREGDDMRVSFVHPDATGGALVELVMKKPR
jgi:methylmalonyl-CoA/ethylmalonyl-CoA epimerase